MAKNADASAQGGLADERHPGDLRAAGYTLTGVWGTTAFGMKQKDEGVAARRRIVLGSGVPRLISEHPQGVGAGY